MVDQKKPVWISFGEHVRGLRRQMGWSLDQLGRETTYSATYHSKVERAVRSPKQGIVEAMDSAFGTNGALLRMWRDVARLESGAGWYEQSEEYEKEANEIRFFHPFVIPGFFQTEGYSRVLISHTVPMANEARIQKTVAARKAWRERLKTEDSLMLSVVIPELVLTQRVGGSQVMREQLGRLAEEAMARGTTIQVLPLGLSDFTWTVGAFRLIYVGDRSPIACSEHTTGEHVTDEAMQVRRLEVAYNKLLSWSLPPDASLARMTEIKEAL
ncbi:helix-turn-helix domain-containing protein [Nocardiopsis algeriensis]|uniref:Transcriptional regulator with XRE-family HTH domain n=1 Tax=Nocardiopsis algeriensis TaxID=1478215 RepID=A0A841IJR5_9ACTN|nr:helix-turn-helix transcriptional regulator [Nocardiopsis algeriensis]MBB6118370.1 transcriptional regulator with XRE-family HTH domain [Nocardiopsis algeriensis]